MKTVRERSSIAAELGEAGDVLEFIRLLWAVDHELQRTSKHMAAHLGITGPQRFVLRIVGRFPSVTAGHLARLLHVHPSSVTEIMRRLEAQGLIRRNSDSQDGRRVLLVLSRRGQALNQRLEGTIEAAVARLLLESDAAALDATRAVLRRLAELLGEVTTGDHRDRG